VLKQQNWVAVCKQQSKSICSAAIFLKWVHSGTSTQRINGLSSLVKHKPTEICSNYATATMLQDSVNTFLTHEVTFQS